jgi:hypothetical protein
MPKRLFAALAALFFASACASTQVSRSGPVKPKAFVTPYEYYSTARPAVMTERDSARIRNAAVQPMGDDTKEDHTQAIIIGTLVGVSVIGGTVAGIMLTR